MSLFFPPHLRVAAPSLARTDTSQTAGECCPSVAGGVSKALHDSKIVLFPPQTLSHSFACSSHRQRQICRDLCVIYFVPCPAESPYAQLLMEVFPLQHQFHDLFWLILQLKRRVGRAGRNSSSFQTIPPLVPQRDRKSLPLQHQDNIRIRQGCP